MGKKIELEESPSPEQTGNRKKTGKKGKLKSAPNIIEGNPDILAGLKTIREKSKCENIPAVATMDYFRSFTYGIPIRQYIPLCRLLGTDVLGLSRSITLVGPEESLKSSFGWFLQRLILLAGGFVFFLDTEGKGSSDLILSIVDLPDVFNEDRPRVLPVPCKTKEQAQEMLYMVTSNYEDLTNGSKLPMGVFYDSIKAGASAAQIQAQNDGSDEQGYAAMHEAKQFQNVLMATLSESINQKPILFTAVNHEMKAKADIPGQAPKIYEAGGKFKEFVWTWKMRLRQVGQQQKASGTVTTVDLKMGKSALHEKQVSPIPLNFTARYEHDGTQHSRFDWDTSLAVMLAKPEILPKERSKDIVNVRSEKANEYTCVKLGMRKVPPAHIGRALHASPYWQERILRDVLHIPKGGILYRRQVYQAAQARDPKDKEALKKMGRLRDLDIKYGEEPDFVSESFWLDQNTWPESVQTEEERELHQQVENQRTEQSGEEQSDDKEGSDDNS